jgi:hypothetical protein
MNTKYEIVLSAIKDKKRTIVETRGFNSEALANYHYKLLQDYAANSKYFNSVYSDPLVELNEDKNWKKEYTLTNFEWSKENGKYIR